MSSTREYAEFVRERLARLEAVEVRPMMGEYIIRFAGRVLGFVADDRLILEDGPTISRLLPGAERVPLFPGSKDFVVVEDDMPAVKLCEIAQAIYEDLPVPKPRKAKSSGAGRETKSAARPFQQFGDAPDFD